jgi:TonB family protein
MTLRARFVFSVAIAISLSTAIAGDDQNDAGCKAKIEDYYDARAIRLEQVGTVLVEFRVREAGPPQDVKIIRSTAPGVLQASALRMINSMRCMPGKQWLENGGAERPIRVNVMFKLNGFEETPERLDPDADEIVITGSLARGP